MLLGIHVMQSYVLLLANVTAIAVCNHIAVQLSVTIEETPTDLLINMFYYYCTHYNQIIISRGLGYILPR